MFFYYIYNNISSLSIYIDFEHTAEEYLLRFQTIFYESMVQNP